MASPIQHENAKGAKAGAPEHSIRVAAKASDVKSVRQVGTDIIITLYSGEQIVLPDAGLRALTDPQLSLLFDDQEVLASALLNPGSEFAAVQAAPVAAPEPVMAAPAEASAPAQTAASQPESIPSAPIAQITQDQYLGTVDPTPAAKSDSGFVLWPWLLAGGLVGAAAPGGGAKDNGAGTTPSVTHVAISGANGSILNHTLNASDEVIVSVTLTEAVHVSGAPTLALNIGGTIVQAAYFSGSDSNTLHFHYTIQQGQNDNNGIGIDANSLSLNGATLTNAAGTAAVITHLEVASNPDYLVDTQPPTATITMANSSLTGSQTSVVTFTFSEPVTGFTTSDLNVPNGALTDPITTDNGTHWVATFTPNPTTVATNNIITLSANSVFDLAGNPNDAAATTLNYSVNTVNATPPDTTPPSALGIVMSDSKLQIGDTSLVTFIFSEPVHFGASDVTAPNGTLDTPVSYDGNKTWYATFTPNAGVQSSSNVLTVLPTFTDQAGLTGSGKAQNYSVDTLAPTVASIVMDNYALGQDQTALVTFTFSEVVTGFANNDLYVPNGVLTGLAPAAGSASTTAGAVWTATLTPNANTEAPANVIQLWVDSVKDLAGNSNTDGFAASQAYNVSTTEPTLLITSSAHGLKGGQAVTISFNFSADPGNSFTWDPVTGTGDITVSGGMLGALGGTGLHRYATFTAGSTDGFVSIVVADGNYTDTYGHAGAAGVLLPPIFIDTVPPVAATVSSYSGNSDAVVSGLEAIDGFVISGNKAADANLSLPGQNVIIDSTTTWHVVLDQNSITNYGQGPERLVLTSSDAVGNSVDTVINLTVDTLGPVFSSQSSQSGHDVAFVIDNAGAGIATSVTVYDANTNDAAASFRLASGGDNALFNINAATGVVKFNAPQFYSTPLDAGHNHVYDLSVIATNALSNESTQTVHLTVGTDKIAVYTDQNLHNATTWVGYLVAPVMVDGGSVFYYWDISGAGTAGGEPVTGGASIYSTSTTTHTFLDGIFNHNLAGDAISATGTTNVYRYATLYTSNGDALHVALPTYGGPVDSNFNTATGGSSSLKPGTAVGSTTAANGSTATNTTYDDLLAVWDAYNGIGTTAWGGSGPATGGGHPTGWGTIFWSATPNGNSTWAMVDMGHGAVNYATSFPPTTLASVALQVL